MRPRNTEVGLRLDHAINRFGNDFRFTLNNRHQNGDVGFRRIYFRCWSESGRGWKALLTIEINLEPTSADAT